MKVTVSPDEMEAYVEVAPWTVTRYRLVEEGGAGREQFRLEEETDFFCPADYEDILTLLEQEGVRYGVDHARIRKLVSKPQYGTFVVAAGLPPQEPTDESVEFFFPAMPAPAKGTGTGIRGTFSPTIRALPWRQKGAANRENPGIFRDGCKVYRTRFFQEGEAPFADGSVPAEPGVCSVSNSICSAASGSSAAAGAAPGCLHKKVLPWTGTA